MKSDWVALPFDRFACKNCKTHLAVIEQLISRVRAVPSVREPVAWFDLWPPYLMTNGVACVQQFHGQHGKAFLFESVSNIVEGEAADRQMTTGLHTVRDIYCGKCHETVGWKYVSPANASPWRTHSLAVGISSDLRF